MKPLPEKMECGYGEEFTIFSPQYAINALIDHLTDYEAEIARRLTKLDNRIQTIANNQLGMKRDFKSDGLSFRDVTSPPLEEQPKRWRACSGQVYWFLKDNGQPETDSEQQHCVDDYRYDIGNYHQTREAAEAYKARLLELVKEIWKN